VIINPHSADECVCDHSLTQRGLEEVTLWDVRCLSPQHGLGKIVCGLIGSNYPDSVGSWVSVG